MIPTGNPAYRRVYAEYDAACLRLVDVIGSGDPTQLEPATRHWRESRARLLDVIAAIEDGDCD